MSVLSKLYFHGYVHSISEAHLAEFDFRKNNRFGPGCEGEERTLCALAGVVGERLTYRASSSTAD